MKKLAVVYVLFILLLAGCAMIEKWPAGSSHGTTEETPVGRKKFSLVELKLVEQYEVHFTEAVSLPLTGEAPYQYNHLVLNFIFNDAFDLDEFKQSFSVEPAVEYELWEVREEIGGKRSIAVGLSLGELRPQLRLHLANLSSLAGRPMAEEVSLTLYPVEPPRVVSFACLTYPEKKSEYDTIFREEATCYLLRGEIAFQVEFSKPMNRESVEKILLDQAGEESSLRFDWKDDTLLHFTLNGPAGRKYLLDLHGSEDSEGFRVLMPPYYTFTLVEPRRFYAYHLPSGRESLWAATGLYFDAASLSPDRSCAVVGENNSKDERYRTLEYLISFQEKKESRFTDNRMWLLKSPSMWAPDGTLLVLDQYLFSKSGKQLFAFPGTVHGACFSPCGTQVACFYDDSTQEKNWSISCMVLYLPQLRVLATFPHITRIKHREWIIPFPQHCFWPQEETIIFEKIDAPDYPETKVRKIVALNPLTGEEKIMLEEAGYPYLSPNGRYMTYESGQWWHESTRLFDLETREEITLCEKPQEPERVFWSDDSRKLAFQDVQQDGKLVIYDVVQKERREYTLEGTLAGWLDGETLLLYR